MPEADAYIYEREMVESMEVGMVRMLEGIQERYPGTQYIFPPIEVESKVGDAWS